MRLYYVRVYGTATTDVAPPCPHDLDVSHSCSFCLPLARVYCLSPALPLAIHALDVEVVPPRVVAHMLPGVCSVGGPPAGCECYLRSRSLTFMARTLASLLCGLYCLLMHISLDSATTPL